MPYILLFLMMLESCTLFRLFRKPMVEFAYIANLISKIWSLIYKNSRLEIGCTITYSVLTSPSGKNPFNQWKPHILHPVHLVVIPQILCNYSHLLILCPMHFICYQYQISGSFFLSKLTLLTILWCPLIWLRCFMDQTLENCV